MKMRIYKLFAAALLVLLCVNLLPGAACAAAADSGSASIPLEINRTGGIPRPTVYGVVIEAVEPSNPMPLNPARTYSDDAKTDPFKAADVFSIAYNEPGVYRYTVRQLAQYSTLTNMRYDARIWRVTVSVSYDAGRKRSSTSIRKRTNATPVR